MLDHSSHCKALVHMMLLYIAHLCQQHAEFFSSSKTLTLPCHKACTAFRVSGTMMQLSQSLSKFLHQLWQQTPTPLASLHPQLTQAQMHYLGPAAPATIGTGSAGLRLPAACVQHLLKCGHQTPVLRKMLSSPTKDDLDCTAERSYRRCKGVVRGKGPGNIRGKGPRKH